LKTGNYQVTLITTLYDTVGGIGISISSDIFDVDLNKEVDYSLNVNCGRAIANYGISLTTSTIIIVTSETKRIIPRIMSDRATSHLGIGPVSFPAGSIDFCMRTVIQKF
jgi:hypothetical protein